MQKLKEMPSHPGPAHLKSASIKKWSILNLKLENSPRKRILKAGFDVLGRLIIQPRFPKLSP